MSTETFVVNATGDKPTIIKDPGTATKPVDLDYTQDWTDWLDLVGDTLNSATVDLVSDGGGEAGAGNVAMTCFLGPTIVGKTVVLWLRGGIPGEKVAVTVHIVTNNATPRKDDRTFYVKVKER